MGRCKCATGHCNRALTRCKFTTPRCMFTTTRCNNTTAQCKFTTACCKNATSRCIDTSPKKRLQRLVVRLHRGVVNLHCLDVNGQFPVRQENCSRINWLFGSAQGTYSAAPVLHSHSQRTQVFQSILRCRVRRMSGCCRPRE